MGVAAPDRTPPLAAIFRATVVFPLRVLLDRAD